MGRWLLLLWLGLLLIPAAGLFSAPERSSEREARRLAQAPALPHTLEQWLALPRATDAFIRDQFGFREDMIRANAQIRLTLGEQSSVTTVVRGRDGFLLLNDGLSQSLGFERAPERAARNAALYCDMSRALARENIRFLVAIPPSPTTIYPEAAPAYLSPPRTPTDYDSLVENMRACGADVLDLRPALRAQRARFALYRRTDTHWTPRGALIAYNAIVGYLGLADMRLPPDRLHWRPDLRGGDLVRLSGALEIPRERVATPDLSRLSTLAPAQRFIDPDAPEPDRRRYIRDYQREGPCVLVIGDSFAGRYFPDYFAPFVRRFSFVHHRSCTFDWNDIARTDPDIVVFAPTERNANCPEQSMPLHFPR